MLSEIEAPSYMSIYRAFTSTNLEQEMKHTRREEACSLVISITNCDVKRLRIWHCGARGGE